MKTRAFLLALLVALPAAAATREAANLYFSAGHNPSNLHGSSDFRSLTLETTFDWPLLRRWTHLHDTEAGAALSYHQIHQPRSWFGHTYGDPDDAVRGEALFFFARHHWRATSDGQPFVDLGTGPMWANRRVPAATSRFNFNSQLGGGVALCSSSRGPLLAGQCRSSAAWRRAWSTEMTMSPSGRFVAPGSA